MQQTPEELGSPKSKSVSLPEREWEVIEELANASFGGNRSAYIRPLIESDLKRRGLLFAGDGERLLMAKAMEALDLVGPEAFDAALSDLLTSASTSPQDAA